MRIPMTFVLAGVLLTFTAATAGARGALSQPGARRADTSQPAPSPVQPRPPRPGELMATAPKPIDINRATAAELEGIPGIGKAIAAKIIAGRPYPTKAGLVQKNILSAALYEKIKDRIIAKQ
jgi:DNA uptake protein ComE-like DNA-binding protein